MSQAGLRHLAKAHQRRWGKRLTMTGLGIGGVASLSLYAAHREEGPSLSGSTLRSIPFNAMGIAAHYMASVPIPSFARPPIYRSYCAAVGYEAPDRSRLEAFRSLAEFFARPHEPNSRPVDTKAALVVPCDGKIIAAGRVGPFGSIEVKGIRYHIRDLVGAADRDPLAVSSVAVADRKESGSRLWFTAIHIRPKDCHKFASPVAWAIKERRHVSGYLLWMNPAIEGLYTQNERVAFLGKWEHGWFSMTAVGAAGRGSIELDLAEKNESFRPTIRLHRERIDSHEYPLATNLGKGEKIGGFRLGSAIVLVFEAPEKGFRFAAKPGDVVAMGQQLATVSSAPTAVSTQTSSKKSKSVEISESRARFRRAW